MSWQKRFSDIIEEQRPLAPLTTYKVGGVAKTFLRPRSANELAELYAALTQAEAPFRILGGGANVLIEDGEHTRPFIYLDQMKTVTHDDEGHFEVEAGYPFLKLVNETVREGWAGLEGLAGIPGQMGGICTMNAGGRWGEVKDVIRWVEVATPEGRLVRLEPGACGFAYRRSLLPGLVARVGLKLERSADPAATRSRLASFLKAKGSSQPLKIPSAGCCFANPEGMSVGRMVEELGLKGERRGDAAISDIHGNFIVNLGQARFDDVLALMELVESSVKTAHGIDLRREVEIWRR